MASCALYNPAISRAVRVNCDGHPERMLPLLNTHWCFLAKGEDLLALWSCGEIRSLGIVATEWYGNEQVFCVSEAAVLFEEACVDFVYRYVPEHDVWEVVSCSSAGDIAFFEKAEAAIRQRSAPVVGDFVRLKDGRIKRVAHIWSDGDIQLCDNGSFYLNSDGSCSMSGSLDSSLPMKLELAGVQLGWCWRFADGYAGAGRGVNFKIEFNLFVEV